MSARNWVLQQSGRVHRYRPNFLDPIFASAIWYDLPRTLALYFIGRHACSSANTVVHYLYCLYVISDTLYTTVFYNLKETVYRRPEHQQPCPFQISLISAEVLRFSSQQPLRPDLSPTFPSLPHALLSTVFPELKLGLLVLRFRLCRTQFSANFPRLSVNLTKRNTDRLCNFKHLRYCGDTCVTCCATSNTFERPIFLLSASNFCSHKTKGLSIFPALQMQPCMQREQNIRSYCL